MGCIEEGGRAIGASHRGLRIGSLFSGIVGLELGLERSGVGHVVFQCEIDPYCRAVLARHWPNVTRYDDVTTPRSWTAVDLLCGGFPCQDVSSAGKGAGLEGARSGLWFAFRDVIDAVRPRFVVVENVASGKARWLPTVRGDLCERGYRTRAYALSASDVGAPHRRARVFVVADRFSDGLQGGERTGAEAGTVGRGGALPKVVMADAVPRGRRSRSVSGLEPAGGTEPDGRRVAVADAEDGRARDVPERGRKGGRARSDGAARGGGLVVADRDELRHRPERVSGGRAGELRGEGGAVALDPREALADRDRDGQEDDASERLHERGARGDDAPRRHRWPPGRGDAEGWRAYVAAGGPEPALRRGAHGLSTGLDDATDDADTATFREQLSGLGNAVVPQCAEVIGRIIAERLAEVAVA